MRTHKVPYVLQTPYFPKIIFLYVPLLFRVNGMLDFSCIAPFEIRGTHNKWNLFTLNASVAYEHTMYLTILYKAYLNGHCTQMFNIMNIQKMEK